MSNYLTLPYRENGLESIKVSMGYIHLVIARIKIQIHLGTEIKSWKPILYSNYFLIIDLFLRLQNADV